MEPMMYVVGATKAEYHRNCKIVPDSFLLVRVERREEVYLKFEYGMNVNVGLLINFLGIYLLQTVLILPKKARAEALKMQQEMEQILSKVSNV
jgi:orotidine-5'-phosphate decarboxylase